ncbi:LamG-like jellyroll fold domain-containing protein [Nonomuraea endophytica]|uniref:LamG-like jellyroll fold domain-containing protein n=1 Tax=Nonomuraea endophytica TaxID=714136 RepID=UPI0037C67CCB
MNTRRPASGLLRRTRHRARLIAALTLPIALIATPAIAQEPTPTPATQSPDVGTPTGTALAQAKKSSKRVEIEALRSQTGTFFANPDGKTVHAELSSTPLRVKKGDAWQPIDTTLIEQDGLVRPKASLGDLILSAGGDTTAARYTSGGAKGTTAVAAPGRLPKPVLKGNTATYLDAYGTGADLVVTVTPKGFRHDVVIRQRPAKGLGLRLSMRLPQGLKLGTGTDKTPGVIDNKGKEIDDLASAPMLDAAALTSPDHGRIGQAKASLDRDAVVYAADAAFLGHPATAYPVTVTTLSETWEGTGIAGDTHVSNVLPDGSANATLPWLLAGKSHSGSRTHRTYIMFHVSGTPLEGGTVHNADLRLHNQDSHTCSDTDSPGIDLQRVTSPWNTSTISWNSQPSTVLSGHVANRGAYSATRCPEGEGELYYSIELIVQAWMDGTPDLGVRLNSVIEPDSPQDWRYYRSDEYGGYDTYPFTPRGPVLFIEYTPAQEKVATLWGLPGDATDADISAAMRDATGPAQAPPALTPAQVRAEARASEFYTETQSEDMTIPADLTPEQVAVFLDANGSPVRPGDIPPSEGEDTSPPAIAGTDPSPGRTDVAHGARISANFTEPVRGVDIAVTNAQGTRVQGSTEMEAGDLRLVFTPAQPLAESTVYTTAVSGGTDASGNVMAPYTWSFTTSGPDTAPPTVTVTDPVRDATGVQVAPTISATFSEAVTDARFALKDPGGATVAGTMVMDATNRGLTFTPSQPLTETTAYTAEVSGAKDAAGNAMAAPYTWAFTTGMKPSAGLMAAYAMDEGTGTRVGDSSGHGNTGTAGATSWQNGKYGKALSFDGASSWVAVQHSATLRLSSGMTLSAWVRPSTVTGWRTVVMKDHVSFDEAAYSLYASNGSVPSSGFFTSDSGDYGQVRGSTALSVDTWSHVAVTYDGSTARLYVNGGLAGESTIGGTLQDDGGDLHIGGNGIYGEYFQGLIDEVRVYNRAQSATEINTDMNTSIGTPGPPDTQAPSAPTSVVATGGRGSAQVTWAAATDNVGVTGYTVHRSTSPGFTPSAANQVASVPGTAFTDARLAAGTYYYRVLAADAAGNVSASSGEAAATVTSAPATPGLVAAYGMEEGTGTTVGDASGNNNTGAARDTTWATGKHGMALSFDGSSSWVTIEHAPSLRLTDKLTLSAWVRPSVLDDLWRSVLMKDHGAGGVYGLYASSEYTAPAGWLRTTTEGGGLTADDPLPPDQWSHLAVTYDGATFSFYLNGTRVSQAPLTGDVLDDGGALRLGGNAFWGEFYAGLIDEVRVYNRVQSAAEIQADMNTPIGAAPVVRPAATVNTPAITKLVISDDTFTVRATDPQGRRAKVEVEVAPQPATSSKPGSPKAGWTAATEVTWSGTATGKAGSPLHTIRMPSGKLKQGQWMRWRARASVDGGSGAWSEWQRFKIGDTRPAVRTAAAADDFKYDRIENWQECWDNGRRAFYNVLPDGRTVNPKGYTRNHFSWCTAYDGLLVREITKRNGQKEITDKVAFPTTVIGRTFQGNRRVEFDVLVQQARIDEGELFEGRNFTIGMLGTGYPHASSCAPAPGHPTSYTGNEDYWSDREISFKFESYVENDMGANNREQIGVCTTRLTIRTTVPSTDRDQHPRQTIRCDSAWYIRNGSPGCIFDHHTPSLALKEAQNENAFKHIFQAFATPGLSAPNTTSPAKAWPPHVRRDTPKKVHGFYKFDPIHRLAPDDSRKDRNRYRSEMTCGYHFYPSTFTGHHPFPWVAESKECDEFPFASTYEGAWIWWQEDPPRDVREYQRGANYSVLPIPADENGRWGGTARGGLGHFYNTDRILAQDAFFLRLYDKEGKRVNPDLTPE